MATFREIVYMCLDILKEHSDDSYYSEEHILFLASKMRGLLIERKYKNTRNSTFLNISDENKQDICLSLESADALPEGCAGPWLKSTEKIPTIIGSSAPTLHAGNDLIHSMVTYIPSERMPYVGHNKWLRNIIYASKSKDGYLYLFSVNPQFTYLEEVRMDAVFADPEEAAKLSCDKGDGTCDILDMRFPLEQALIPSCVELVVQELIGSRYAPEDKRNNAADDLSDIAVTQNRARRPVEDSQYKPKTQDE